MTHHPSGAPHDSLSSGGIVALPPYLARLTRMAMEQLPLGIMITDAQRLLLANPALHTLLGFDTGTLAGRSLESLGLSLAQEKSSRAQRWQCEASLQQANGQALPVMLDITVLPDLGDGQRGHLCVVLPESWEAACPEMPGQFQLKLLHDRTNHALLRAARHAESLALLCVDIDRFQEILDGLGCAGAEELLSQVSHRLTRTLRAEDTVARVADSQLAVLLESDVVADMAQIVADRILEAFDPPFVIHGNRLLVTASVGIALSMQDGDTSEQLLHSARSAMQVARKRGADQQAFCDRKLNRQIREQQCLTLDLQNALLVPEEQFSIVYQPQVDLSSGHCIGLEALLRWRHPKSGLKAPAEFLPQAQKMGLLPRLDRWVLQKVIKQRQQWQADGHIPDNLRISVNIDQASLDPEIMPALPLDRFLKSQQANLEWLTLEVANYGLEGQVSLHSHLLRRLKALGLSLAVDGVGNDMVDLGVFSSLPISQAKINGALASGMGTRASNRKLLNSLHRFMDSLDVTSVVVGIEQEDVAKMAQDIGIGFAQGNHFSPPLEPEALVAWLAARGVEVPE